jgi:hypothetical protein
MLIVVQVPEEYVKRVHLIASDVGFEIQAGVLENKVIAIQPPVKTRRRNNQLIFIALCHLPLFHFSCMRNLPSQNMPRELSESK